MAARGRHHGRSRKQEHAQNREPPGTVPRLSVTKPTSSDVLLEQASETNRNLNQNLPKQLKTNVQILEPMGDIALL